VLSVSFCLLFDAQHFEKTDTKLRHHVISKVRRTARAKGGQDTGVDYRYIKTDLSIKKDPLRGSMLEMRGNAPVYMSIVTYRREARKRRQKGIV